MFIVTEYAALRTGRWYRPKIGVDSALSLEELHDPPLGLVPDSIVMEFGSKALMRNFIKCLAIIQQDGIYLLMSVEVSSWFMFSDFKWASQDLFFWKSC